MGLAVCVVVKQHWACRTRSSARHFAAASVLKPGPMPSTPWLITRLLACVLCACLCSCCLHPQLFLSGEDAAEFPDLPGYNSECDTTYLHIGLLNYLLGDGGSASGMGGGCCDGILSFESSLPAAVRQQQRLCGLDSWRSSLHVACYPLLSCVLTVDLLVAHVLTSCLCLCVRLCCSGHPAQAHGAAAGLSLPQLGA